MLRLQSLSLVAKRRTIRQLYPYSYPYAAVLNSTFVRTSGGQLALGSPAGMAAIFPGAVMVKLVGSAVTLCQATVNNAGTLASNGIEGTPATAVVWGLSANYVGGTMDELKDFSEIGVWRGRNGIFEVLAPVFTAGGAAIDSSDPTKILTPNTTGQLNNGTAGTDFSVARVVDNFSSTNAIKIELLVP